MPNICRLTPNAPAPRPKPTSSCRMSVYASFGARARNARDRTPNVEGEEVNEDESLSTGQCQREGESS